MMVEKDYGAGGEMTMALVLIKASIQMDGLVELKIIFAGEFLQSNNLINLSEIL